MGKHYTFQTDESKTLKAWASPERIHFKPMFETGRAIKGMGVEEALKYLEAVIEHKRAVPFFRYNEGIPHHEQGKEWGCPSSRWPEKCCRLYIKLIKNALSGAPNKPEIKADRLVISHVQCNRAQKNRWRRIHQAHGRVKSYASYPTCVQICLSEPVESTPNALE